ncbi:hypothetical protein MMC25_006693 [Agyrium rufum]|nr:hypothetical protein [Agyrium rufum]
MGKTSIIAAALAGCAALAVATAPDVSSTLQNILANTDKSDLYTYPTDLTRGIVPVSLHRNPSPTRHGLYDRLRETMLTRVPNSTFQKGIHSHNDYWRDLPFYTALSVGCVSIEADVWLYNGTLHVGHEQSALTNARTFSSLYIEPILSVLERQNPKSPFLTSSIPTKNGVFDGYSSQTLYLFVDVKTDGETTWPYVVKALEPLRSAGYLSSINESSTSIINGPVTVVGTGNTPLNQIQPISNRDYFFDAFLPNLTLSDYNLTKLDSPIASVDFAVVFGKVDSVDGTFNDTQLATLNKQVAAAHAKGIAVRYWDQPAWPITLRNGVWRTLWQGGADLINADDVTAAAGFSDQSNYW